jgi:hypothetical protein
MPPNFYFSLNIVRVTKLRRMIWVRVLHERGGGGDKYNILNVNLPQRPLPQKWSGTATSPSCNWPNITEYNWYGCQIMRELTDQLAKPGTERPFIESKPSCGISVGVTRDWKISDHRKHLDSLRELKPAKALVQGPSAKKTRELLNLNRDPLRWTVGHCRLKDTFSNWARLTTAGVKGA